MLVWLPEVAKVLTHIINIDPVLGFTFNDSPLLSKLLSPNNVVTASLDNMTRSNKLISSNIIVNDDSSTSSLDSPFLNLPLVIKKMIYCEVFTTQETLHFYDHRCCTKIMSGQCEHDQLTTALLRTCSRIKQEASEILWARNRFAISIRFPILANETLYFRFRHFDISLSQFHPESLPPNFFQIRELDVYFCGVLWNDSMRKSVVAFLKFMVKIRVFRMYTDEVNRGWSNLM